VLTAVLTAVLTEGLTAELTVVLTDRFITAKECLESLRYHSHLGIITELEL